MGGPGGRCRGCAGATRSRPAGGAARTPAGAADGAAIRWGAALLDPYRGDVGGQHAARDRLAGRRRRDRDCAAISADPQTIGAGVDGHRQEAAGPVRPDRPGDRRGYRGGAGRPGTRVAAGNAGGSTTAPIDGRQARRRREVVGLAEPGGKGPTDRRASTETRQSRRDSGRCPRPGQPGGDVRRHRPGDRRRRTG